MDENQNFAGGIKRKGFRLIFIIAAMFVLSFAVVFLWNAILPQTTHLGVINYWQALGLLALCRLLFGNFNFGIPWGRGDVTRDSGSNFMNMGEKEKMSFKEEWKKDVRSRGNKKPAPNVV